MMEPGPAFAQDQAPWRFSLFLNGERELFRADECGDARCLAIGRSQ